MKRDRQYTTRKQRLMRRRARRGIAVALVFFASVCACALLVFNLNLPTRAQAPTATAAPTAAPTSTPTPTPTPSPTPTPAPTPSPAPAPVVLTVSAAGDCTLGGNAQSNGVTATRFAKYAKAYGYGYFLENVRDIFAADDLTVVNLEGPLTNSRDMRAKRTYNFKGAPEYAQILQLGGVECANIANNHAKDFGAKGVADTLAALRDVGIAGFGYQNEAIVAVKGVNVGLLGMTEWDYSLKEARRLTKSMRARCDILIVTMHWGEEKRESATKTQRNYAHALVEEGADLVLGHHSHVLGGIERYRGCSIVYSLANFCFGGNKNPSDKMTMIYQQSFTLAPDGQLLRGAIHVVPCTSSSVEETNDYRPTPATGALAERILRRIDKLSQQFDNYPILAAEPPETPGDQPQ